MKALAPTASLSYNEKGRAINPCFSAGALPAVEVRHPNHAIYGDCATRPSIILATAEAKRSEERCLRE